MEDKACVYALRHNPTSKVYVGCSRNVQMRINEHIYQLKIGLHPVDLMQEDCDKHGCDYSYFILFETNVAQDAFLMEKHFMSLLGTRDKTKGYNYNDGSSDFDLDDYCEYEADTDEINVSVYKHRKEQRRKRGWKPKNIEAKENCIKELREKLGMTQGDLSEKADVSRYTIVKMENKITTSYRIDTMEKIANALGAKIQEVFQL